MTMKTPKEWLLEVEHRVEGLWESDVKGIQDDAIAQLTKERDQLAATLNLRTSELHAVIATAKRVEDQLAAKCAEMQELICFLACCCRSGESLNAEDQTNIDHALSTNCGAGWLSPEKKNEMEERHRMEMCAMMAATIQNTESTVKDRIARDNPYWTQAYADVCAAIDREMVLLKQKKVLVEALDKYGDHIGGCSHFDGLGGCDCGFEQALEEAAQ